MHAATKVDGRHRERLVHRHDEVTGAVDATPRTERTRHRLAERDAKVFDGMVLIHVEVAGGADLQIEPAVTGDQFQHVIEEADAGADVISPASVERQCKLNRRFLRRAIDNRATALYCWGHKTSSMAAMHSPVWLAIPAVIRTHPAHDGSAERSRT